jgi:hypothetical protein
MSIVYLVYIPFWKNSQGVIKKISDQTHIWSNTHSVTLVMISDTVPTITLSNNIDFKFFQANSSLSKMFIFQKVLIFLDSINVDLIYIRTIVPFFGVKTILKKYKTILEINSLITQELNSKPKSTLRNYLNYYKNMYALNLHKYLKGVVSVTYEIQNKENYFNLPSRVIPNGILVNPNIFKSGSDESLPQLVFIGSPNQEWHGVSEIINFAKLVEDRLHFHIIGAYSTNIIFSENNITYYPYCNDNEISDLIIKFDIAIGSAALYKKGMYEACPLKTRRYLALGIPIIMPYNDTIFINKKVPNFIFNIENSPNSLVDNLVDIVSFCYSFKKVTYNISSYDFDIDINTLELNRLDFFSQIFKE